MRDSQRRRVYRWEQQAWWGHRKDNLMSLIEAKDFLTRLNFRPLVVTFPRKETAKAKCTSFRNIQIPPWGLIPSILCHEIAHCVTWTVPESHGPEFVRTYIALLHHSGQIPSEQVAIMSAVDSGIRVGWTEHSDEFDLRLRLGLVPADHHHNRSTLRFLS